MTDDSPLAPVRHCYVCDVNPAAYEAEIGADYTPIMLLCVSCAAIERASGTVDWIRTLRDDG